MHLIASGWRRAPLSELDQALCAFAENLARAPESMSVADIEALRSLGLDDRSIHDATQVVAYFSYINRVADALGVEPEDFIRPWEEGAQP